MCNKNIHTPFTCRLVLTGRLVLHAVANNYNTNPPLALESSHPALPSEHWKRRLLKTPLSSSIPSNQPSSLLLEWSAPRKPPVYASRETCSPSIVERKARNSEDNQSIYEKVISHWCKRGCLSYTDMVIGTECALTTENCECLRR